MFTVHSRGVFTQDKSGYFSNSKVYGKKWDREKVFTMKGCSLIRGVHYERFHCIRIFHEFSRARQPLHCLQTNMFKLN